MSGTTGGAQTINWKLPLLTAIATGMVLILLMVSSENVIVLDIYLFAPIVSAVFVVLLVSAAVRRKKTEFLSLLLAFGAFLGVSGELVRNEDAVRDHVRWLLWSRTLKAQVLAQQDPPNGDLKHMEWESKGWANISYTTAYLIYDPADSLSTQNSSDDLKGLVCRVPLIRLEKRWYSVRFYSDQTWSDCAPKRAGGH